MARKDISNKLIIFKSDKKNDRTSQFARKGHWKESAVTTQGRTDVEVGTLLLNTDKNVIVDKVLSSFECLSSKFEVSHILGLNNNY